MTPRILIVLAALAVTAASLAPQASFDRKVIDAVAPNYPPIAVQARIQGTVQVLVDIDEAGAVVSAQSEKGHPLFRGASLDAARKWRFEAASDRGKQTLTFVFGLVDEGEPAKIIFKPSYSVEIYEHLPHVTVTY
jgi:TonB family protein